MKKIFTLLMSVFAFAAVAMAQDTYIITGEYNNWSLTDNCIEFDEIDGGYMASVDEFTTGIWGFKIVKNPQITGWTYQYGIDEPIATAKEYSLKWVESGQGGNIHLGAVNNSITLHNVTFEFYPSANGDLDYFVITANEAVVVGEPTPQVDQYMMVGTFQGWSFENNPLVFTYDADKKNYTASIDEIFGDWKIVKNKSWTDALGSNEKNMLPGNTYNLVKGGDNTGFASGVVVKNATFTLTIQEDGNAALQVDGEVGEIRSYGLVGAFQGWSTTTATFLEEQEDGSWTTDIANFPGGSDFKISIDKTWTCFLGQEGPAKLSFGEAYTCVRGNNDNNLSIGNAGETYNVHVVLVVAADGQSADLTITDTVTGVTMLKTNSDADVIYNLAGQRLASPLKGVNIINGKTVLVK